MLFSLAASSRWAVSTGLCLRWLATIKVSGPVQPCSNHKISQSGWNTDPQLYGKIDQNWMRSSQFWHHAGSTQDTTPGTSTELLLSHGYAASTSLPRQTSGPREPRDLHRIPQRTSDVVPLQHLQLSNAFHDGIMIHMLVHQPRRNSI